MSSDNDNEQEIMTLEDLGKRVKEMVYRKDDGDNPDEEMKEEQMMAPMVPGTNIQLPWEEVHRMVDGRLFQYLNQKWENELDIIQSENSTVTEETTEQFIRMVYYGLQSHNEHDVRNVMRVIFNTTAHEIDEAIKKGTN